MAKYVDVHPENPQARLIEQVADAVREDALIAYPTDSGYALGCRLGNSDARRRILAIRELDDKHHFTLMCSDFAQLGQLVQISNTVFRAVRAATPGRTPSSSRRRRRCRDACSTRRSALSASGSPTTSSARRCLQHWASRW